MAFLVLTFVIEMSTVESSIHWNLICNHWYFNNVLDIPKRRSPA